MEDSRQIKSAQSERMVWVLDREGREFACYAADLQGRITRKEELSEDELRSCLDLTDIFGDIR